MGIFLPLFSKAFSPSLLDFVLRHLILVLCRSEQRDLSVLESHSSVFFPGEKNFHRRGENLELFRTIVSWFNVVKNI